MSSIKINHVGGLSAYLFFFTVGWTGLYLGNVWLRPYVVTGAILFFYLFLKLISRPVIQRRAFGAVELFLLIFLVYCLALGIFHPNTKTAAYLLAYAVVFLVAYVVPRVYLLGENTHFLVMRANVHGVAFICLFAMLEVIVKSLWNVHVIDFLPKSKPDIATTTFGSLRIHRAYSLMPEPTILGMYLNTLGLLALYWVHFNAARLPRILFYMMFFSAYLLAGSSAAIMSLAVSILFFIFLSAALWRPMAVKTVAVIIGICMLGLPVILLSHYGEYITQMGFVKKLLEPSTYSTARFQLWLEGIEMLKQSDGIGGGLGYISSHTGGSYINWYLSLFIETGVIGTSAILGLMLVSLLFALRLDKTMRPWFFVAIMAGCIHFFAVSTFFNPYLFVVIAIMLSITNESSIEVRWLSRRRRGNMMKSRNEA